MKTMTGLGLPLSLISVGGERKRRRRWWRRQKDGLEDRLKVTGRNAHVQYVYWDFCSALISAQHQGLAGVGRQTTHFSARRPRLWRRGRALCCARIMVLNVVPAVTGKRWSTPSVSLCCQHPGAAINAVTLRSGKPWMINRRQDVAVPRWA